MTTGKITAGALVAGVAGRPIAHSLSPLLHNSWISAAGLDAAYVAFSPAEDRFAVFVEGLRGGVICGLNVTLPFKEQALAAADEFSALARAAGAANLLLFHQDGGVEARNTDGEGLLYAFARQAPALRLADGPVALIGAGGAAKGAVAALVAAGVSDIRVINRTKCKAEELVKPFAAASAWGLDEARAAFSGVKVIINATSTEVGGCDQLALDFSDVHPGAVAMDMLYRPLKTKFLAVAEQQVMQTVDGLDMLIGQAIPSFEAFFGRPPPAEIDARALLLNAMRADR